MVLTIASGALGHQHLTALALEQAGERAREEVQLGLVGRVSAGDFAPPFTGDRLDNIADRLDPVLTRLRSDGSGILRINLIARDGTVVYSDLRGARRLMLDSEDNDQLVAALNGSIGAELSSLSSAENSDLRPTHDGALEVYVPVWMDDRVVGAYEIYQEPGLLRALDPLIWGALLACWAVGIGVAWSYRSSSRHAQSVDADAGASPVVVVSPLSRLPAVRAYPALTPREREVLRLMATLPTNRDIAAELCVSEETVRSHVKRILHKLQQPGRTQAVAAAIKAGLLDLS